jgi:hypothetical protein
MVGLETIGRISPRIGTESLQVLAFSTTSHTGSSYKIRKKPPVSSAACELNLSGFAGPRINLRLVTSHRFIRRCAGCMLCALTITGVEAAIRLEPIRSKPVLIGQDIMSSAVATILEVGTSAKSEGFN